MRNPIGLTILIVIATLVISCEPKSRLNISPEEFIEAKDVLSLKDSLAYVFQNQIFQKNAQFKELSSNNILHLNELELSGKVICYVSEIQCSTCIDQELRLIKSHYKVNQILLFCNYSSERDLKLYLKINKFDFPTYLIKSPPSQMLMKLTSPTYFKLDSNFAPSSVFFASVSTPNTSSQYHNIMSNK